MTYPSIHAIWARWAPPLERSRLAAVAFSGSYVGTVIALPMSGLLAENINWEAIFYFFGEEQAGEVHVTVTPQNNDAPCQQLLHSYFERSSYFKRLSQKTEVWMKFGTILT